LAKHGFIFSFYNVRINGLNRIDIKLDHNAPFDVNAKGGEIGIRDHITENEFNDDNSRADFVYAPISLIPKTVEEQVTQYNLLNNKGDMHYYDTFQFRYNFIYARKDWQGKPIFTNVDYS
jgi:hypothetical protein